MSERIAAIVGRPNVGKSALFNRLAASKIAIVHDMPGVTRDRITAECSRGSHPFTIIDTGGIGADVDTDFTRQVAAEADIAVETAHVIVFVVDGPAGITPVDQDLAQRLRRSDKPIILAVNKIDHEKRVNLVAEFNRLGLSPLVGVSAEHDRGTDDLIEAIEARLPPAEERAEKSSEAPVKIAFVGRPNVGKSSITNALLNDDRTLVSPISGTTRDSVDIPYQRHSKTYILIDTAGIRHRSKVSASVEVFSVMRAEASIERADLCCLVIDAAQGVSMQDKKIAGAIQKAGKPCVVAVNKWDLVKERTSSKEELKEFIADLHADLFALNYAPLIMCSAKNGEDMTRLFKTIEKVRNTAKTRLGTGVLNRLLGAAMTAQPPPAYHGRRFKVLYGTQPNPPPHLAIPPAQFVLFCNSGKLLEPTYRRYLEAKIRQEAPFTGVPIFFRFRAREERSKKRK